MRGHVCNMPALCACMCLQGAEQCMRCGNGIPHSKHADFFKYAEVLIAEADVRTLSKAVLDEMQGRGLRERASLFNFGALSLSLLTERCVDGTRYVYH